MSNYILKSFIHSPVICSNSHNTIFNNSETVKGRILLSDLCQEKLDWNIAIFPEIKMHNFSYFNLYKNLIHFDLKFPRCFLDETASRFIYFMMFLKRLMVLFCGLSFKKMVFTTLVFTFSKNLLLSLKLSL